MISAIYYERGPVHALNQDAVLYEQVCVDGNLVVLAVVCDGIGGMEKGEFASTFVTECIKKWLYQDALELIHHRKTVKTIMRSASRMLHDCHRSFLQYGKRNHISLGTTVTMFLGWKKKYMIIHAGDSRAYLLSKKSIQLTKDDVDQNGYLVKCVGNVSWKSCQQIKGRWKSGMKILLCTDGFWKKLNGDEVQKVLCEVNLKNDQQGNRRLREIGREVIRRGEKDNISAILVEKENGER